MGRKKQFIKTSIWMVLFLIYLIITFRVSGGLVTSLCLSAGWLVAYAYSIYRIWKGKKSLDLLSDSNNAVLLTILGLTNIIGGDTVEYIFIVVVVVVGIGFDIYNRKAENTFK